MRERVHSDSLRPRVDNRLTDSMDDTIQYSPTHRQETTARTRDPTLQAHHIFSLERPRRDSYRTRDPTLENFARSAEMLQISDRFGSIRLSLVAYRYCPLSRSPAYSVHKWRRTLLQARQGLLMHRFLPIGPPAGVVPCFLPWVPSARAFLLRQPPPLPRRRRRRRGHPACREC